MPLILPLDQVKRIIFLLTLSWLVKITLSGHKWNTLEIRSVSTSCPESSGYLSQWE